MCGIIGGFSDVVERGLSTLRHRGPDAQGCIKREGVWLGHTRLAIIDLNERSNQPFIYRDVALVFNGELWNYQELRIDLITLGYEFHTTSDTEVMAAALSHWGVQALARFDGMFAIGWTTGDGVLYLARDKYGEIPLHIAKQKPFLFASELKALLAMGAHPKSFKDIAPGTWAKVTAKGIFACPYYDIPTAPKEAVLASAARGVRERLTEGARIRSIADVPVCTLLSGGIDSAAVAYHLKSSIPNLVAYTAVFNRKSRDLICAKEVARALEIPLVCVEIPTPRAEDLSRVIEVIEMPYKAQIEIGWACLILAERMQADGFKVTFSGEGSDELWASYGFAYHGLLKQDWHQYRKDLFLSQSRKNFVRCNKIFMRHSIECRLPFLHAPLVEYAIALQKGAVQTDKSHPKAVIQQAYRGLLPQSITDRPKVAFQDGLGLKAAITKVIPNPKRYYDAEFNRLYNSVRSMAVR